MELDMPNVSELFQLLHLLLKVVQQLLNQENLFLHLAEIGFIVIIISIAFRRHILQGFRKMGELLLVKLQTVLLVGDLNR